MPDNECTDCRPVGRCAAHPVQGWLLLRDVAADFRELFGDEAELLGRKLSGRTLRPHDWRLMVEYGPHPAGDRRNGRVTFHDGADAAHVVEYLTREAITLEAPTAVERVDSACCGGTGLDGIKRRLAYHFAARTDPCQDRGVDWPCDVAEAFGVTDD